MHIIFHFSLILLCLQGNMVSCLSGGAAPSALYWSAATGPNADSITTSNCADEHILNM